MSIDYKPKKPQLYVLAALGILHCAAQFVPWLVYGLQPLQDTLRGLTCERGMDWSVHIIYVVILTLATPFLGGIYIHSVASDNLFGQTGFAFLAYTYAMTLVYGVDTYYDSFLAAKALSCSHSKPSVRPLAQGMVFVFWAGLVAQMVVLFVVGARRGGASKGFKWAAMVLLGVTTGSQITASAIRDSDSSEELNNSSRRKGGLSSRDRTVCYLLRVDADSYIYGCALILARLFTEHIPQSVLQYRYGSQMGFNYVVVFCFASSLLMAMYGIYDLYITLEMLDWDSSNENESSGDSADFSECERSDGDE